MTTHFIRFIDKFSHIDQPLCESIIAGYSTIFESEKSGPQTIVFDCRDREDHMSKILDMYKNSRVSGTFVIDADSGNPDAVYLMKTDDRETIEITKEENVHDADESRVRYKVTISTTSEYGDSRIKTIKEDIKKLVKCLGQHGNGGHSYSIKFVPNGNGKIQQFFWDGDGSDFVDIESIK